ncbi:family 43 glycosylhydrolase [Antribacter sp. KLBMP9083]|uniref:Family 43 glycosylhydrolase n=1 Tax=Antribacter soli TaxID=2910976 RepID=A0AA41QFB8_9MICO|nr:family 43 glycosylhydrolase [Antribacter soli]MCF4122410.1 family 43 glycosylhydrolase [Antribacter soli]
MHSSLAPSLPRWLAALLALALALTVTATAIQQAQAVTGTPVTNPLVDSAISADPWVGVHDGKYYYAATTWNSNIVMRTSSTLEGLGAAAERTVFTINQANGCCTMWAPELHQLDGPNGLRWYLYYSAEPSSSAGGTRQTHVLESAGNDPMGPYTYKGVLNLMPNGGWAIDGSVLRLDGADYFMFSAFGSDNLQSVFIAPMSSPWQVSAFGTRISAPTLAWETQEGAVNEGPTALQRDGRTFLTYSASACWGPNYKIGMLEYTGTDPLSQSSWTKKTTPIFERNDANGVYGPAHHTFFKSPDGKETWIAYHANSSASAGCGTTRRTRVQKISWNGDGTPNLGVPVSTATVLTGPSGEDGSTNGQSIKNRYSNLCLDDYNWATNPGAEVRQWTCSTAAVQDWYLDYAAEGYFQIKNRNSGLCLDDYNFGTEPGAEVRQWTCNGLDVQQWEITDVGSGWSTIRNRHSGLCLDDYQFGTTAGAEIRQWTCNGNTVQHWSIG